MKARDTMAARAATLDDLDARLDEALKETFPASDPIAVSDSHGKLPTLHRSHIWSAVEALI